MLDSYANLELRLSNYAPSADGGASFDVAVASDEVGEQARAERVTMSAELARALADLERRALDGRPEDLVRVGRALGDLLLPPIARAFFKSALASLRGSQGRRGLRLRILCVSIELERVPWEFACVETGIEATNDLADSRQFLVCQPGISVVRYVVASSLVIQPRRPNRRWRLLVVACEPAGMRNPAAPLQIEEEIEGMQTALQARSSVAIERCAAPNREELRRSMLQGADIFHFAGHGNFVRHASGQVQSAHLMLTATDGSADPWSVAELSGQLTGKGVRLAVLGACRSGQTDGHNAWAGIAPSLVRAGIPIVVGMQYGVYDKSALMFSRTLYQTLAAGTTIDEAVAEARSAIAGTWAETGRDFATPVLYMHTAESNHWTLPPDEPADKPAPPGLIVDDTLREIAQLHDAKCVHDALHKARVQPFADIQARCRDFPDARTRRDLARDRDSLRTFAAEVRRLALDKCCEEVAMTQLSSEFDLAIDTLTSALANSDSALLEDAISSFDSLFSYFCVHIDAWMIAGAKRLDLDGLLTFLHEGGAQAQAAENLRRMAEQVRARAEEHTKLQMIDNRLLMIRNVSDDVRFQAICRHWKPVSLTLAGFLPDDGGTPQQVELRQRRDCVVRGIESKDSDAATQAFDEFCSSFDYGFYTVDADLKGLCGKMRDSAVSSLTQFRAQ